jgi:hypothetical protein
VVFSGDGGGVSDSAPRPLTLPFALRANVRRLLPAAPRRVVAHMRVGDVHEAARRGLMREANATAALRAALPRDAFVLSDDAEVYSELCEQFACPPWRALPHSSERYGRGAQREQTEQTWADWWTMASATEMVLATPSSFASSALLFSKAAACVLTDGLALARCAAELDRAATSDVARGGERNSAGEGESERASDERIRTQRVEL